MAVRRQFLSELQLLLDQDVSHRCDVLVAIIWINIYCVATRVGSNRMSSSAKPDSGVAGVTCVLIVSNDTNSRFGVTIETLNVKSFLVTVALQRGLRPNELLPRVTAQWSSSVCAIFDQWVQGCGLLFDDNRLEMLIDLHSKTDLVKRCVPISR